MKLSKVKKAKVCFLMFVFVFLMFAVFSTPEQADARRPFGGRVNYMLPCPCSGGAYLLSIGPPVPAQIMFYPYLPQYAFGSLPRPGVWALGMHDSASRPCLIFSVTGCMSIGQAQGGLLMNQGFQMVGTSM